MGSSTSFAYLLGLISTAVFIFNAYHCFMLHKDGNLNDAKDWILSFANQLCDAISPLTIIICSIIAIYLWHIEIRDFIPLGTYCYNVEITTSSGTYTVPAEIERILVDVDEDNTRPEFHIKRIYWPNGGYFDFEDFTEVEIEKTYSCYAVQIEDFVDIYMMDKRATHHKITEDIASKPYHMYNTVVFGAVNAIAIAVIGMSSKTKTKK